MDPRVGVRLWTRIRVVLDVGLCRALVGQSIRLELANWLATVCRLLQKSQHVVRNQSELNAARFDKW
jgi:hypothetical protein